MMFRFRRCNGRGQDTPDADLCRLAYETGIKTMRWETPKAIDFRFGMEITMYIANR